MSDNRLNDPRLADRQRASDPRLNAVRPLPPDKFAPGRPRSREPSLDQPPDARLERQSSRGGADRRGSDRGHDEEAVPSRYSPPPSLKPYTIPRRAGQKPLLKETSLDSREGAIAIETVKNSLWNPETVTFEFTKVEIVNNDSLEAEYVTKRKELKEAGRTTSELSDHFVFSHMRSKEECRDICQRGIHCKSQHHIPPKASCSLGDKKYGVYLCRCADALTKKIPTQQFGKESIMLICKVMKGRVKTINDQADQSNPDLEPTPDFDGHISRRFQRGKKMPHDHIYDSSQIYLYEVDLDNISADDEDAIFAKRPRQVLPYAVVYYKIKQNAQPVAEPKVPLKETAMLGAKAAINVVGQANVEPDGPDMSYEECLKNLKYFWQGFCFMKNKFLAPAKIGLFTRKEVFFPMETPNITIQKKISWERLSQILPGKIYRKPPCRLLQPETEVVGIKFIHGEIHGSDKATEEVINTLYTTWLNTSMAGVCSLSTGYNMYIIPSSLFTDTLGLSDPSYPPVLHCLFMKENIVIPRPPKDAPPYEQFILHQQISLNSRICENDELKVTNNIDVINRPIPPLQQQQMLMYTLNERQSIAKYLEIMRRYHEKRGMIINPLADVQQAAAIRSQIPPHPQVVTAFPPRVALARGVLPPNLAIPMNATVGVPQNVMIRNFAPNSLLTTVPTGMVAPIVPPQIPGAAQDSPTLVSPASSDSFSSTEGQGTDDQAIDFCLSFKRDGASGNTERVKLFPEEKNKEKCPPTPVVPVEVEPLPPPPPPPDPMDDIPHIPPPLFTQPAPAPLYGEPVPVPLYSEPAPPTPPPVMYCESPPPPPPPPKIPTVQEVEALYAPTLTKPVVEETDGNESDLMIITDTDTDSARPTDVVKKNVKKSDAILINTTMSDSDSEDNLVINLDDETESENAAIKSSDVEKSDTTARKRHEDIDTTTVDSDEDSQTLPVHSSTPAKLNTDDVFIKSSQNLLSQLSSVLPKSLSKKSHKKSKSKSSKNLHLKLYSQEESLGDDNTELALEKYEEKTSAPAIYTVESDNYENLTMDESSQEGPAIEEHQIDDNPMEVDCSSPPSSTGDDSKRPAKCSSPSLTQLTFTKEKILKQLSLLKEQTEEKRRSAREKEIEDGEYVDSGTESQESEVIPFLGGEEDDEGLVESDEEFEKRDDIVSPQSSNVAASPSFLARDCLPPLDVGKAEMALFDIGTKYYDQLPSPSATGSSTAKTTGSTTVASSSSQVASTCTPPLTHSPDRPVGKVSPVSTTSPLPSSCSSDQSVSTSIDMFSSTEAATRVSSSVTVSTTSLNATSLSASLSGRPVLSINARNKASVTAVPIKPAFVPAFSSRTTSEETASSFSTGGERPRLKINLSTAHSSSSSPSGTPTSEIVPSAGRPTTLTSTQGSTSSQQMTMPGINTTSSSPLQRAPPLTSVDSANPKKIPIMEVSPVVRSTQAPRVNPSNRPSDSLQTPNFGNPAFRQGERPAGVRPPVEPDNRGIIYPVKGTYGVNREQADAMYQNREDAAPGYHDTSNRLNQPRVPRAYRSGSRTPDEESSSSARSYRGRSPSPNSSDWDTRSSSLSRHHRDRDRRRHPRSRSRSRSPSYSRSRSYRRSRSPKRSRDRSPRHYRDRERHREHRGGDWEKQDYRKIYGSDVEVYQDDKPPEREGRRGERDPREDHPAGDRLRHPPSRFDSPSYRSSPSPPPPLYGAQPPPRDGPPASRRIRYNDNSYPSSPPRDTRDLPPRDMRDLPPRGFPPSRDFIRRDLPPHDIPPREIPPRGFPNERPPPLMGVEMEPRPRGPRHPPPPHGRPMEGRDFERSGTRPPYQPPFHSTDHPLFNRNNADGPPPPRQPPPRDIRERLYENTSTEIVGTSQWRTDSKESDVLQINQSPRNGSKTIGCKRKRNLPHCNRFEDITSSEDERTTSTSDAENINPIGRNKFVRSPRRKRGKHSKRRKGSKRRKRKGLAKRKEKEMKQSNLCNNEGFWQDIEVPLGSDFLIFNNDQSVMENETVGKAKTLATDILQSKVAGSSTNLSNDLAKTACTEIAGSVNRDELSALRNETAKKLKDLKNEGRYVTFESVQKEFLDFQQKLMESESSISTITHLTENLKHGNIESGTNDKFSDLVTKEIVIGPNFESGDGLTEPSVVSASKKEKSLNNDIFFRIERNDAEDKVTELKDSKDEMRFVTFESIKKEFQDFQQKESKDTTMTNLENENHISDISDVDTDKFSDLVTKEIDIGPNFERIDGALQSSLNSSNEKGEPMRKDIVFRIDTNDVEEKANKLTDLKDEMRFVTFESIKNEFLDFQRKESKIGSKETTTTNLERDQHSIINADTDKFSDLVTKRIDIGSDFERVDGVTESSMNGLNKKGQGIEEDTLFRIETNDVKGKVTEHKDLKDEVRFVTFESVKKEFLDFQQKLLESESSTSTTTPSTEDRNESQTNDRFNHLVKKGIENMRTVRENREVTKSIEIPNRKNTLKEEFRVFHSEMSDLLKKKMITSNDIPTTTGKDFNEPVREASNKISDQLENSSCSTHDFTLSSSQASCLYSDISGDENGWKEWLETPFVDEDEDEVEQDGNNDEVDSEKRRKTVGLAVGTKTDKREEVDYVNARSLGHFFSVCKSNGVNLFDH